MYILHIILIIISIINFTISDVCDYCKCSNSYQNKSGEEILIIHCDGLTDKKLTDDLNLKTIEWPNTDMDIIVKLTDFEIFYLPEIIGPTSLIGIYLENNSIRNSVTNPFAQLKYLQEISLANNHLIEINKDFFKSKTDLISLNLSNTSISDIDSVVVSGLKQLKKINLNHNLISKITTQFLASIENVETLTITYNKIYSIEKSTNLKLKLKELNLSNNILRVIIPGMFDNLEHLRSLDLSYNLITQIDENSFKNIPKLFDLNLSFNSLNHINNINDIDTVEVLSLQNNKLNKWNFKTIPKGLRVLYIQNNDLDEINGDQFQHLKVLNLSNNQFFTFPNILLPSLEVLDISYNKLSSVPQGLGLNSHLLETIILDHNPIEIIRFTDEIQLKKISLSYMPLLRSLDADSFKNIKGRGVRSNSSTACIELVVSHCTELTDIDENALSGVDLCKLDLSYNRITTLSENLTNWKSIENGINIQGNPFHCNCSSQWMLDNILNYLYQNEDLQYLLKELRCNQPEQFHNQRFVKFYKRFHAFCSPSAAMMKFEEDIVYQSTITKGFHFYGKPSWITIVISCLIVLIALIAVGIYWTKQQNKALGRKNRLYS